MPTISCALEIGILCGIRMVAEQSSEICPEACVYLGNVVAPPAFIACILGESALCIGTLAFEGRSYCLHSTRLAAEWITCVSDGQGKGDSDALF